MAKGILAAALVGAMTLSGVGYYAATPYITAASMMKSVKTRDAKALNEAIDYPALRSNIKAQVQGEMMKKLKGDPASIMGMAVAGGIMDAMLNVAVTPEGLERMMAKAKADMPQGAEIDYETEYDGLDRFLVTLKPSQGATRTNTAVLVFERRGIFEWKMTNIEFDLAGLGQAIETPWEQQ